MSEETQTGKAKLNPGAAEVKSCPFCRTEFEDPLPLNIFNQCDPEEGCGETFRVVKQ